MEKEDAKKIVALAIPGDRAGSEDIAETLLDMAVDKIGRRRGLNFNREWVEFSLTAGKATYEFGKDVLTDDSKIKNVQQMWRTDVVGWPIEIVGLDRFNELTSGGTSTGSPSVGTVYIKKDGAVMEVYPIPDGDFPVKALIKRKLTKFEDVPEEHRDVIVNTAITIAHSLNDPDLSLIMLRDGLKDIEIDSLTAWRGNVIKVERPLGANSSRRSADSHNLRPQ